MGRSLEDEQIIYIIENSVNQKVYVGKTKVTLKLRFGRHKIRAFNRNSKSLIHTAMRKHGFDKFSIRELTKTPPHLVDLMEKIFIRIYEAKVKGKGYNLTDGGDGGNTRQGYVTSEETKSKLSAAHKGKPKSETHKEALRIGQAASRLASRGKKKPPRGKGPDNPMYGIKRPERSGVNHPGFGKKMSDESKAKRRATRIARGQITNNLTSEELAQRTRGEVNVKENGDSEECCSLNEPFAISA